MTSLFNFSPKRVMILAPHTDDGEFGCGGLISRFVDEGVDIYYSAFSVCEQSVPYGVSEDQLQYELMDATETLGISAENVLVHRYEVRKFPEFRQQILQQIIDTRKEIQPDLVLMPCLDDIHQDHQVIAAEGLRAYKDTTILSYELPWNNLSITTSAFVELETNHIQKKVDALACYQSQLFRHYADPNFIWSLARTRGAQIAREYAEVYQLVRLVF